MMIDVVRCEAVLKRRHMVGIMRRQHEIAARAKYQRSKANIAWLSADRARCIPRPVGYVDLDSITVKSIPFVIIQPSNK